MRMLFISFSVVLFAGTANAQGVIVDHTSVALFEQIPDEYLTAAANLTMMFVDRSVGVNIHDGLTCLNYPSDEAAPTSCKRFNHVVPQFSSSANEVNWSRPGGYSRANWVYYSWPGGGITPELPCGVRADTWHQKLECFIRYVDANPTAYRVLSYQNSFLEVDSSSDIASLTTGYFVNQTARYDIFDFEAMEARHPGAKFLHHTTSLARSNGGPVATSFNDQMRQYARTRNKFLLDIADIESHDPAGNPCYDNRDGVPYTAGNASENYPDDGFNFPAICQHYTRESEGGHLGSPEVGKIRVAKAFWVIMARIAGWTPGGTTTNTPPAADRADVTTAEDQAVAITLTGSDADGDPLTFRAITQPAAGTLTGTAPDLIYTPVANFNGTDSFRFVANDGEDDSAVQTVALTVTPVNDSPSALADNVGTERDTSVFIWVLGNDVDIDGDPLTITNAGAPQNGTTVNNVNNITYTPNPGFEGADSFTYEISDGLGGFSTSNVTVTVTPAAEGAGYALRFDGSSDYVSLAPTSQMMAPGWQSTKTVELWFKPEGAPSCTAPNPLSCDAIFGDRPRWWGVSRGIINGSNRIWVWNWSSTLNAISFEYSPDQWTHVALVHGGGTLSAFKNGVLVGSVPSGATQQPTTGVFPVLHVGGIINSPTRNWTFQGEIDEVRVWNTARTAQDISRDMRRPLAGTEQGLAAYYRMSDGAGSSLTDDSGIGWMGTLHDGGQGVPPDGPALWVPSGAFDEGP
jgi:hypothetical protein